MSQDSDSAGTEENWTVHRVAAWNRKKRHGNSFGICVVHLFGFLMKI